MDVYIGPCVFVSALGKVNMTYRNRNENPMKWSKKCRVNSCCTELIMQGIARTQSPSPRNYAPESPTFEAIAGVSPPECNGQASPWENPLVDQGVSCAR